MFQSRVQFRIRLVLLICFLLFFVIVLRVFYIQFFEYKKLKTLAENLWSRNLPISSDRGLITDRNGKIIVNNITTTSLVFIPNQIKDKEESAKKIAKILNVEIAEILRHMNKKTSIERVHPEGRKLSYEIASKIDELNIDGVYLLKESKRNYVYGTLLSHVLGYVGIDNQGLSGIELEYDNYLTGKNGAIKYFSDGKGQRLNIPEVYEEPQAGINIALTIDLDLQIAIERELDNVISKYNPEHALIIAMNPKTGEILGMSSRPNFDSNNYKNYGIEVLNRNLPIWMAYEPGSTFKIITLASSLEEKTIDLFKDTFYDKGSINVEGARIKCWKSGGHGAETMLQVVENSCNPGFVLMGQKLGKEKLFSYISKFGFGEKTGIDLNGEATGLMFKLENVGPVELATVSFGQGISVTPLQQVRGVSAAINGGNLYKPYIVDNFKEPQTNSIIKKINPTLVKKNVISEETSALVRFALESVVANGTGRNAYIENYRIGGKTGTAQKVNNGKYMVGNYILSFVGFAPANDPEIVVYVAIDNPKGVTQYGGTVSAPVAKRILQDAITILGIKEDKEGLPKEYQWLDKKYMLLPNVTGMSIKDATKALKGFKFMFSGTGSNVLYQSPEANLFVEEGSTVKLFLG